MTPLNDAQLRSLRTTLRLLEERLRQAGAWLQGETEQGILYERITTLPSARRREALRRIDEALIAIAALAAELALESEPEDAGASIRGMLSASWADLCDSRSAQLKRYGPVDPNVATTLDPKVERLTTLTLRIAALMDNQLNEDT